MTSKEFENQNLTGKSEELEPLSVQNVQRLEGEAEQPLNPPSMPSNLQQEKAELIASGKHKGNTKELANYKAKLPRHLSQQQIEVGVGLLLSDASLQANSNGKAFRLKMQQSDEHKELLDFLVTTFEPYVLEGVSEPKRRAIGNIYREAQTIQHEAFGDLVPLFSHQQQQKPSAVVYKEFTPKLADYLTPLCIGVWFSGDGGKRDYGVNQGKAVQLHTQGFDKPTQQSLAQALNSRYGWEVVVKPSHQNPKTKEQFYLLQVEASSFDSFYQTVEPFVLNVFKKRFPSPRKEGSRFRSKPNLEP